MGMLCFAASGMRGGLEESVGGDADVATLRSDGGIRLCSIIEDKTRVPRFPVGEVRMYFVIVVGGRRGV